MGQSSPKRVWRYPLRVAIPQASSWSCSTKLNATCTCTTAYGSLQGEVGEMGVLTLLVQHCQLPSTIICSSDISCSSCAELLEYVVCTALGVYPGLYSVLYWGGGAQSHSLRLCSSQRNSMKHGKICFLPSARALIVPSCFALH